MREKENKVDLFYTGIDNKLKEFVNSATKSLFIVTPYLKKEGMEVIFSDLIKTNKLQEIEEVKFIVRNDIRDILTGYTDLSALSYLLDNNSNIHIELMTDLHAKFIIVDDERIFMGSSNYTLAGIGAKEKANAEIDVIFDLSEEDAIKIKDHFSPGSVLSPDMLKEMQKEVEEKSKAFKIKFPEYKGSLKDILDELKKEQKSSQSNETEMAKREKVINELLSHQGTYFPFKDYLRCYHIFHLENDKNKIKVIEASLSKKSEEGFLQYDFTISNPPAAHIIANKIDFVLHTFKEQDESISSTYILIPSKILMRFIAATTKGTDNYSIKYDIKKKRWFLETSYFTNRYKVKSRVRYRYTYDLIEFKNVSVHGAKSIRFKDSFVGLADNKKDEKQRKEIVDYLKSVVKDQARLKRFQSIEKKKEDSKRKQKARK